MNHKAFTIIEILIVVALLAIAGVMVIPMMSSAASMQIYSAANMIAADAAIRNSAG
jgi:prepilin-type N-terminal cleavage/methylation domain-containing protein